MTTSANDNVDESIKNGLLSVLELIADGPEQIAYQCRAPQGVNVSSELFNQWDDFYEGAALAGLSNLKESELKALEEFNDLLNDVSSVTPKMMPPISDFQETADWRRLRDAALKALAAFKELGPIGAP